MYIQYTVSGQNATGQNATCATPLVTLLFHPCYTIITPLVIHL